MTLKKCPDWSIGEQAYSDQKMHLRFKPILFALGAGCIGFGINCFEMPVFGGTTFVFGGALSLLIAFVFGPALGGLTAAIAFSRTWISWQHPTGFICYTLEATVVGWLIQQRRIGGIRATALFWGLCGAPILWVLVGWLQDIPFPSNWAILIKYPLNGLLMASIALPLSNSSRVRHWLALPAPDDSATPLQQVLFRRFGVLAGLPLILLVLLMGQTFDRALRVAAETSLHDDAHEITDQIERYLDQHRRSLITLAEQLQKNDSAAGGLADKLEVLLHQYPGFMTLLVADRSGEIIAAAPANNPAGRSIAGSGLDVSDRDYFKQAVATRLPYISNVFRGRGFGTDLIVAVSVPVLNADGTPRYVIEGSLRLKAITEDLASDNRLQDRSLVLIDRAQNVVLSTGRVHLAELSSLKDDPLDFAGSTKGELFTLDWRRSPSDRAERHLAMSCAVPSSDWRMTILEPIWKSQRTIAEFYAASAFWGLLAVGLALWLARETAGTITQSLTQIASATESLVGEHPRPVARIDLFPSQEFAVISTDLHAAASTLIRSNRNLAEAISDRDQSHHQLRQVLMHLDEKVRERTTQLEEASRIAESANNAKSGFLASMSHELRTPLNVILGMSEILREKYQGPLTDRQMECVVAVEESGRHLLSLINDVLDLSKIESGMMQLEVHETGVANVCEASLRFVREAATKKGIRLGVVYQQSAATFIADPRRLKQILVNLLSNAVKFTPAGGTVTLEVRQNLDAGTIAFAVQDDGIGIEPQHLVKLFQPFQQIDNALNRKYAGTGLGLSLVKRMAQMHGGTVEVQSEPGKGSRFTVTLPLSPPAGQPIAASAIERMPKVSTRAPMIGGAPLILIAEDNPLNVQVYTEHLSRSKCRFLFATTGREAIELAQTGEPDLVLMDVQMPEVDGLEAIRRLRADPRTAALPIIAVTALARPEDRIRCLEAGASSYLSKPVRLKDFTEQIVELLERKPAAIPAPTA